jgi:hypothetical protein
MAARREFNPDVGCAQGRSAGGSAPAASVRGHTQAHLHIEIVHLLLAGPGCFTFLHAAFGKR